METVLQIVATAVLVEVGWFLWFCIERERELKREVHTELSLIDSIREEHRDG